jgi:hypothetical protein
MFSISTKELVYLSIMGAAWFVLDFIIGQWINVVTGMYMIGFLAAIVSGFFGVILVKSRPKFFTFTIPLFIFGVLALPTGSAGPVGFWPKVAVEVIVGLIADSWFKMTKYKNWSIIIGFYIIVALLYGFMVGTMALMGIPEVGKIASVLPIAIPGFWVIGSIGLWLGFYIWRKIKDKAAVKQVTW